MDLKIGSYVAVAVVGWQVQLQFNPWEIPHAVSVAKQTNKSSPMADVMWVTVMN